jgi:hypothetical protein
MRRAVWMNTWDTEGREPDELLDFLEAHGLNGCNLGLAYHGGRMLLPMHPTRVVLEHEPTSRASCQDFLVAAARRKFDARAWVVLCHDDSRTMLEHSVVNAFGEQYPYALCPAHAEVRERCLRICREAASTEGIRGLDIEALSFMGYEHGGLHDKRGVPSNSEAAWWLSVCCCDVCSRELPGLAPLLRERVRRWLDDPYAPVQPLDEDPCIIAHRQRVQRSLLASVREALPSATLNLRIAPDPRFSGGKCSLPLEAVVGLADEVTYTFFRAAVTAMHVPPNRPVPAHCGFIFHEPDCRREDEVRERFSAVAADGYGFYSFGMAARPHWRWLQNTLRGTRT